MEKDLQPVMRIQEINPGKDTSQHTGYEKAQSEPYTFNQ